MLDTVLEARLVEQSKYQDTYTQQVRWHLQRRLTAGKPNLTNIAEDMAVSERSLQRHLREEGYSFQAILSETRHELAKEYLSQPKMDFSENTSTQTTKLAILRVMLYDHHNLRFLYSFAISHYYGNVA